MYKHVCYEDYDRKTYLNCPIAACQYFSAKYYHDTFFVARRTCYRLSWGEFVTSVGNLMFMMTSMVVVLQVLSEHDMDILKKATAELQGISGAGRGQQPPYRGVEVCVEYMPM